MVHISQQHRISRVPTSLLIVLVLKAEKDGIPIVTEEWVQKSIKAGKKSTDASLFLSGGPSSSKSKGAATAGGAKQKSKKVESEEEEEEEDEEDEKPKKMAPAKKAAVASSGGSVFSGEVFCVSGSFSVSQAEMRKLIITNGGDVVDTPNKKCTYLVADAIGSSKTMKAQKDGIKIVTEEWVNDSIAKDKMSTNKKLFLSSGNAGDDDDADMEDEDVKPKKKKTPAKHKIPSKAVDGPKKKKAKTTLSKRILWIDPNNLANNKEHLDAVGIDRVESVGSLDEATTWLKNQQKVRPKILSQIKIVSNMARMESGVFQPQAGITTATSLAELGVPYENILVYTSKERASGKGFPKKVRIVYEEEDLHTFLGVGVDQDDAEDDAENGIDNENSGGDEADEDEEWEGDPVSIPGSIKVNKIDPSLTLKDGIDVLYTNTKPAAADAPIALYRTLIINKVRDSNLLETYGSATPRVYLFDARPENHSSIQLIEDAFAALLKSNLSMEDPEKGIDDQKYSTMKKHKFPYEWVRSLEWLTTNETGQYQTQAEVFAGLKEETSAHVVIVNHEFNHANLKKQLLSKPLSIDSVVCTHILDYVKPDSPVHSPTFTPKLDDKLYHMYFWTYCDYSFHFILLDARESNLRAIEFLRETMGPPFHWTENGYLGCFLTEPGAPKSEGDLREIILRQRITSATTIIEFHIGQFRTGDFMNDLFDHHEYDAELAFRESIEEIGFYLTHEDDETHENKMKAEGDSGPDSGLEDD